MDSCGDIIARFEQEAQDLNAQALAAMRANNWSLAEVGPSRSSAPNSIGRAAPLVLRELVPVR
jgi:hypothetical protein